MEWGFIEIVLGIILLIHVLNSMNIISSRTLHTKQNTELKETMLDELEKESAFLDNKILQINNRFDSLYERIATVDLIEEKFKYFTKQIYEFNGEEEQEKRITKKLEDINYAIRQMNKENSESNK